MERRRIGERERERERESELNWKFTEIFGFQFCFGDFRKRKLEGKRIGERERENWIREI